VPGGRSFQQRGLMFVFTGGGKVMTFMRTNFSNSFISLETHDAFFVTVKSALAFLFDN
jgi:hypothetical protein